MDGMPEQDRDVTEWAGQDGSCEVLEMPADGSRETSSVCNIWYVSVVVRYLAESRDLEILLLHV